MATQETIEAAVNIVQNSIVGIENVDQTLREFFDAQGIHPLHQAAIFGLIDVRTEYAQRNSLALSVLEDAGFDVEVSVDYL